MTQQQEEDLLFQKVVNLKKERDLLYVIFEELQDLKSKGFYCKKCKNQLNDLFSSVEEYKKWKKNANTA